MFKEMDIFPLSDLSKLWLLGCQNYAMQSTFWPFIGSYDDLFVSFPSNIWVQERRYLLKEFPELLSCDEYSKVLEVGCGNGSTALPILR